MPYYVYRIVALGPVRRLEDIGEHAAYGEAAAQVKRLRAEGDPAAGTVRMIFAENRLKAEELLSETRPPEPLIGDDY
jgi:hypothetical protein